MADGAEAEELLWRAEPREEGIPKRVDRYRVAELAPVLEEVSYGLRHAVDAHGYAVIGVVLDAF